MTESEFNKLVDQTLEDIEQAIDDSGVDIDYDNAGGILTLIFENQTKIIINRQGPVKQIWVATKSGGYHFDYDDSQKCWLNDDNKEELFTALNRYCTEQSEEVVHLGNI